MFLASVLRVGREQAPVRVRNMSPNGAMVESPLIPGVGSVVHLMRGGLTAKGIVVWTSHKRCGLYFPSEVSVQAWLASPTKVEQQRVDNIIALVRSGAIPPSTELVAANDPDPRTRAQLVDDLGAVVDLMQGLEDELTSSMATLERHGMKLQHLDIAMQMLRAVASELSPADLGIERTAAARLQDLRVSCAEALSTP